MVNFRLITDDEGILDDLDINSNKSKYHIINKINFYYLYEIIYLLKLKRGEPHTLWFYNNSNSYILNL